MNSEPNKVLCPKCNNIIRPTFKICSEVHLVCYHCSQHCDISTGSAVDSNNCLNTEKWFSFEASMFENVKDLCQYGCCFQDEVLWLQEHEDQCYMRPRPAACMIGECLWKGSDVDLVSHVDSNHPDQLVELDAEEGDLVVGFWNPVILLTQFNKNNYYNYFYWLILCQSSDSRFVIVQEQGHTGPEVCPEQKFANYSISSHDSKHSIKSSIAQNQNDPGEHIGNEEFLRERGTDITSLAGNSYVFHIDKGVEDVVMQHLTSELECDICRDMLRPPIRQCATGHSFCCDCAKRVANCPTCQSDINESRNYTLERLIERVNTGCRYRDTGCGVTGPADKMAVHVRTCVYMPMKCCSEACDWTGCSLDLSKHMEDKHKLVIRDNGSLFSYIMSEGTCFQSLYKVFDNHFVSLLTFSDNSFGFNVNHLTLENSSEFYFDVEFSNSEFSLSFRLPCTASAAENLETNLNIDNRNIIINLPKNLFQCKICAGEEREVNVMQRIVIYRKKDSKLS